MVKGSFMLIEQTERRSSKEQQVSWSLTDFEPTDKLLKVTDKITKNPNDASLWMEKGLELSKSLLFKEAIDAYSIALSYNPFHALIYRHRGHRYLSIRMYKQAVADFELSLRLDPANWDTWYHLGLSYYLLEDFSRSEKAYKKCLDMTESESLYVAVADWYWKTLMRLNKKEEANKLLSKITKDIDPGTNSSYLRTLLLYKGELTSEELFYFKGAQLPDLELSTQGYGLGCYFLMNGEKEKAEEIFQRILSESTQWSAFGYLAAEMELKII